MGPHPGDLYPFQRHSTRKALWKLVRVVVFLGGALVLGAAGAAQSVAGSSTAQGVAEPSGGAGNRSSPPTEPGGHRPAPGTTSVLVKLNTSFSADEARQLVAANGGSERATIPALRVVVVDIPSGQLQSVRGRYQKDKRVRSVEVDNTRKAAGTPSDPLYSMQWNLPKIGWDQVYGSVTPSGTATLAILDTGVDASHPDLAGKLLPGYSAFAGSDPLTDPNGHGTEMAGITVAATDNQMGVAGVAYSGVSIMPVQVLDSTGVGQDSDIVNGVIWATDNGANVILMPFSNGGFSQTLQDAVSYAWSKGVVLVAATGNDSSSSATYPAGDTDVVGVSATDQNDALWSGSNYGADTFIAAPGVDVPTTEAGGAYITITGTSASSAMVAGVVAFERAMDPAASNSVIVGRLAQDADPAGTASETGNGRVNMQRVVADASRVSATPIGVPGGGPLFGPYTIAALQDGDGSMAVTATTAIAGSSGNSFTFTFTAGSNGGNMNGGAVAINVPSGWTSPQTTSSASPGFISTPTGNCGVASTSITGTGPWTVTFVIDVCSTNKQFTFTYAGGGTKVSAPTGAMAYQFTTQTKASSGGTLKDIQPPQPTITVNPGTASKLVFTSSALSFAATSSPTAGPITIQSQDSFGNPSNPSTAETIALSSSSPDSPKFSLTSGGGTIPSVSIPSSVNSVSFFYGDTKAGTPTVTATGSGGFSSTVSQTATVNPGTLHHLSLSPTTSAITFGQSQTYTATGQDQFNNTLGDVTSETTFAIAPDGSCATATCTPSTATSHTITGTDSGKTGTANLSVNKADTTTALASNHNPSTYGDVVTFTATVTANAPSTINPSTTGLVTFKDGSTTLCSGVAIDAGGKASCPINYLAAGSRTITAIYSGDSNYNASPASTAVIQVIDPAALSIAAGDKNKVFGEPNPAFTVSYSGFVLGEGPFALGGTLVFSTAATTSSTVGSYSITPSGLSSTNYAITFFPGTLTVSKANTTTALVSTPNPSTYGQSVTFTATVTANAPSTINPASTGSVTFNDGSTTLCSAVAINSGGKATCAINSLDVAGSPHSITAIYSGDSNYNASPASSAVSQAVNPAALSVTTDPSSKVFGQLNPSFTVSYSGFVLGQNSSALGGSLSFSTSATTASVVGPYSVTPSGLTSTNYAITFFAGTLTVSKANTTTALVSTPNPSTYGQSVTFTATVTANAPSTINPASTGSVTFKDGSTTLCSAVAIDSGGKATCAINSLDVAGSPHSITAIYSGDSNYNASPASAVQHAINPAAINTTAAPSKKVVSLPT